MKLPAKLTWTLCLALLIAITLGSLGTAWTTGRVVEQLYVDQLRLQLQFATESLAKSLTPDQFDAITPQLAQLVERRGAASGLRLTVIRDDGTVLADNQQDPARMANHAYRSEVAAALSGELGETTRFNLSVREPHFYGSRPYYDESGELIGVVRASAPTARINQTIRAVQYRIYLAGALLALLTMALVLWLIHRHLARPLALLEEGGRRMASGDLNQAAIYLPEESDLSPLADLINLAVTRLNARLRDSLRAAHERQVVLASMIEGVIAIDTEEQVITINDAAARATGVDIEPRTGRSIYEVVRNAELQRFLSQQAHADQPLTGEVTIRIGPRPRYLKANGSLLRNDDGTRAGAVVVLHDVTRLRELEIVRQQFVANVSHELKTPITAIKAAVETILEDIDPDDAEPSSRFLRIVVRQADRLNAIVEDLLTLARIEQESERKIVELAPERLAPVLRSAAETCQLNLESREMALTLSITPDNLTARINAPLLEQALVNLLDNAIKYCSPGASISLTAQRLDHEVIIDVSDDGPGIEPEHLPRIFERFYRTDKARSRSLGGTGLGLAIVKHIALAHGGRISVESEIGKGTTFRIHLPDPDQN